MLAGGRRRRAGGAARAHRGPRAAAPPLDHRDARPAGRARPARRRRHRAPGSRCSPARRRPRPGARRCSTSPRGEAGIVIGTHALLEETVAVPRPRPGRRRRAAPVRRRAARRPARPRRDDAAARARDDRDPDPAHGRDDGVRRPGGLDARPSCPAGRSPIATHVVPAGEKPHFLERAWQRVREEVDDGPPGVRRLPPDRRRRGRRARHDRRAGRRRGPAQRRRRWPCSTWRRLLAEGPLAGLRVEVLHGRMPAGRQGRRHARVRRRRASTCWSPPPSSRSASTCPTRP